MTDMNANTNTNTNTDTHTNTTLPELDLLRFVVVGSVDDGKSTLIGRLLHDTGSIYEDQLAAVKKASKQEIQLDYSLFTDGLKAEREQGITIDVAYRYFATPTRKFIIADTPGHVQYTRNMATGASTAEAAILLIDARLGVLLQSKRHAYIAALLGIKHLIVCINKMDLVEYQSDVFTSIAAYFQHACNTIQEQVYKNTENKLKLHFLPVSAVNGDNIVNRSPRMDWYSGPTLLEILEKIPTHKDTGINTNTNTNTNTNILRFPVQTVLRPHLQYRAFAGQITSGTLRVGMPIMVLPSGRTSKIVGIDVGTPTTDEPRKIRSIGSSDPNESISAPLSCAIRLQDEIDVSRGDVLVSMDHPPAVTQHITAMLVWLDGKPMHPDTPYFLQHTSNKTRCKVDTLVSKLSFEDLQEHTQQKRLGMPIDMPFDMPEMNDICRVQITTQRHLVVDPYQSNRHMGAFILIDPISNATAAAGMILHAGSHTQSTTQTNTHAQDTAKDLARDFARDPAKEQTQPLAPVFVLGSDLFDAKTLGLITALLPHLEEETRKLLATLHIPIIALPNDASMDVIKACQRAGIVSIVVGGEMRAKCMGNLIAEIDAATLHTLGSDPQKIAAYIVACNKRLNWANAYQLRYGAHD